jgi:hypothetical protein
MSTTGEILCQIEKGGTLEEVYVDRKGYGSGQE